MLQGRYTKACDVFSLGATVLELSCDLDLPRGGNLWHSLRKVRLNHPRWQSAPV